VNFVVEMQLFGSRLPLGYNVLELNFSLGFETISTEILLTKLNVLQPFAKKK
jgi:hypothetical protein